MYLSSYWELRYKEVLDPTQSNISQTKFDHLNTKDQKVPLKGTGGHRTIYNLCIYYEIFLFDHPLSVLKAILFYQPSMFLKMTKDMTFHLYSCTTIKKMLLEMGKEIDIICGFSIYRCFHSNILTVGVVNFVLLYVQIQKSLFFALTFFSSASSVFRKRPELCCFGE